MPEDGTENGRAVTDEQGEFKRAPSLVVTSLAYNLT